MSVENIETTLIGGERRQPGRTDLVDAMADDWAESVFYAQDPEGRLQSEYLTAQPVGGILAGVLKEIRRTKDKADGTPGRDYGCFVTDAGDRFRAYLPGQLRAACEKALSALPKGVYMEITYLGKEKVDNRELHQFDIKHEKIAVN